MSFVTITEYRSVMIGDGARAWLVPEEPPLAEQTVAIGMESEVSEIFNDKTRLIRIQTWGKCSITIGEEPVANAGSGGFSAGQTEYRGIPCRGMRLAVILVP